jgi:hypothetical protein
MTRRYLLSLSLCLPLLVGCWCVTTVPDVDPIHEVEPVVTASKLLIVEETADRTKLPNDQQSIFTSVKVRKYLREHDIEFRVLDRNDVAGVWQEITDASKPKSAPWLYLTAGKRIVCSEELPGSVDAFLARIKPLVEPR